MIMGEVSKSQCNHHWQAQSYVQGWCHLLCGGARQNHSQLNTNQSQWHKKDRRLKSFLTDPRQYVYKLSQEPMSCERQEESLHAGYWGSLTGLVFLLSICLFFLCLPTCSSGKFGSSFAALPRTTLGLACGGGLKWHWWLGAVTRTPL